MMESAGAHREELTGSPSDGFTGWMLHPATRIARLVLQRMALFPILRLLTPVSVRYAERLKACRGPVIVVANHVSHLDAPVLLKAIPASIRGRLVVAAAKDYFYRNRFIGALVSLSFATIPFDRKEDSQASLAGCAELLSRGWSLLIFPEGTRSPTAELGRVRHGVAVLAKQSRLPVLPMFVHGLGDIMPKGTVAPLPGGVVVDVGEPIAANEDVEVMREQIEAALRQLAAARPEWGARGGQE